MLGDGKWSTAKTIPPEKELLASMKIWKVVFYTHNSFLNDKKILLLFNC